MQRPARKSIVRLVSRIRGGWGNLTGPFRSGRGRRRWRCAAGRQGAGVAAVLTLALASFSGCTSSSLSDFSPGRLYSELELIAERRALQEAVEADQFPEADDDGL